MHISNEIICENYDKILRLHPEKLDKLTCFYYQRITTKLHKKVSNEYENFKLVIASNTKQILSEIKLKFKSNNSMEVRYLPLSIDYEWLESIENQSFITFLFKEALLHDINIIEKSIEELQSKVKEEVLHNINMKELQVKLKCVALLESIKFLIL